MTAIWRAFAAFIVILWSSTAVMAQSDHDSASTAPNWPQLSRTQQQALHEFKGQWPTLSVQEKKNWLRMANRLPSLSVHDRARASARIREWARLPRSQRKRARKNYRLSRKRGQAERRAELNRYRKMTPEQQSVLRHNGATSNTAARSAFRSGLSNRAGQPLADMPMPPPRERR